MKGRGKSYETENVVTAQSSEMNSPFFRTYDIQYVLLELLDGEIEIPCVVNGSSSGLRHVLLNELGVRGCACASRSELTVCMKKLHRRDPTKFLSRDVCER